ncbi:MAG TPA: hypothetical protein VFJ93_03890 [Gaiellaceae bacterium]|nr:hypothetical protein [Gaiellaceae bacterium]
MPDEPPTYFGAAPRAVTTSVSFVSRIAARARMFAGFAARTIRAWLRAAGQLVRLRLERRTLDRKRKALQYDLGGAALDDDDGLVRELRGKLRACIDEIGRSEDQARAAIGRARRHTTEEQSAVARTRITPPR